MRTKLVSFFIFFQELSINKSKALRLCPTHEQSLQKVVVHFLESVHPIERWHPCKFIINPKLCTPQLERCVLAKNTNKTFLGGHNTTMCKMMNINSGRSDERKV